MKWIRTWRAHTQHRRIWHRVKYLTCINLSMCGSLSLYVCSCTVLRHSCTHTCILESVFNILFTAYHYISMIIWLWGCQLAIFTSSDTDHVSINWPFCISNMYTRINIQLCVHTILRKIQWFFFSKHISINIRTSMTPLWFACSCCCCCCCHCTHLSSYKFLGLQIVQHQFAVFNIPKLIIVTQRHLFGSHKLFLSAIPLHFLSSLSLYCVAQWTHWLLRLLLVKCQMMSKILNINWIVKLLSHHSF